MLWFVLLLVAFFALMVWAAYQLKDDSPANCDTVLNTKTGSYPPSGQIR